MAAVEIELDRRQVNAARSLRSESPGDILESAPAAVGELRTVTADIEVASAAIRDTYAPARLEVGIGACDFELDLRRFRPIGVELSLMSVGAEISLTAPPSPHHYVIAVPVSGSVTAGVRSQSHTLSRAAGIVISPNQPVFFTDWTADYRHLCIRIATHKVNSALSLMLRRPVAHPAEFAFPLDVAAPRSRPLMRALELAALEMLEDDQSAARVVMASSISQLVVNSLLISQDHSYAEELRNPLVDPDSPEVLRIAQRYIIDHASEPITVADIARAASVSIRALEEGFARYLHLPPMGYLRDLRLVQAHEELCRSTPEATTVRAIAERWGFRHAGRFSTIYRERFGVSPSDELRGRSIEARHLA
ncbi:AraC family transcriptional regulator [Mycolicibacterium sp. YH-1]|uniref:AraC family transcriptional regulator n=1 Tax=Mycolicibacterium sp. YH-1 TaxID=2908837 RepID=UPI001F4C287A|nr:AraC family transcriptional regulator [Mycolicibacterium sp. YH-1]UNB54516.1 AraC family transcriptional regulator [Mycolicibacterium sp. YH-1]